MKPIDRLKDTTEALEKAEARLPVVLFVDDDDGDRELFREFLKSYRCEAYEAASGQEAIELAKAHKPDLVLLDLKMPGMDGVETLKQLKELNPEMLVSVVSGFLPEYEANRILKISVLTCIKKPVRASDFKALFDILHVRIQSL